MEENIYDKRIKSNKHNIAICQEQLKKYPDKGLYKRLLDITLKLEKIFEYEKQNNLKSICDMTNKEAYSCKRLDEWEIYVQFYIVLMAYTTKNDMWNYFNDELTYNGYNDEPIISAEFFKNYYINYKDKTKEEIKEEFKRKKQNYNEENNKKIRSNI